MAGHRAGSCTEKGRPAPLLGLSPYTRRFSQKNTSGTEAQNRVQLASRIPPFGGDFRCDRGITVAQLTELGSSAPVCGSEDRGFEPAATDHIHLGARWKIKSADLE